MGNSILKQLYKAYLPIQERHTGARKYVTLDNGGRSFMVYVHSKKVGGKATDVWVYKNTLASFDGSEELDIIWRGIKEDSPILFTDFAFRIPNPGRMFIGHSPKNKMTEFSGAYGPEFLGNSILVHKKDLDYVCIGSDIFEFTALDRIVEYVSPVGNNGVPYPYAVDTKGRHYSMLHELCTPTGSGYAEWRPKLKSGKTVTVDVLGHDGKRKRERVKMNSSSTMPTPPPEATRCVEVFNKVPKRHRKDPYDWFHYLKDGAFPWLSRADTLVPIRHIHGRVM